MKKSDINKKEILSKITPIIEQKAEEAGLIALEVDFAMEAGNWHLRIFIFNPEHQITHEDCQLMTKNLDDLIDELIPIPYYLEVSSPGLERKLKSSKEYSIFKGSNVEVKLKQPVEGNIRTIISTIIDYDSGILKVKELGTEKEYDLDEKNISSIRLKADFSKDKNS